MNSKKVYIILALISIGLSISAAPISPLTCQFSDELGLTPGGEVRSILQEPFIKNESVTTDQAIYRIDDNVGDVTKSKVKSETLTLDSTKSNFDGTNDCAARKITQVIINVPGKKEKTIKFDVKPSAKAFKITEELECSVLSSDRTQKINERKLVGIGKVEKDDGGLFIASDPCGSGNDPDEDFFIKPDEFEEAYLTVSIDANTRIDLSERGVIGSAEGNRGATALISRISHPEFIAPGSSLDPDTVMVEEQDIYRFEATVEPGFYSIDVASAPAQLFNADRDQFEVTIYGATADNGSTEDPEEAINLLELSTKCTDTDCPNNNKENATDVYNIVLGVDIAIDDLVSDFSERPTKGKALLKFLKNSIKKLEAMNIKSVVEFLRDRITCFALLLEEDDNPLSLGTVTIQINAIIEILERLEPSVKEFIEKESVVKKKFADELTAELSSLLSSLDQEDLISPAQEVLAAADLDPANLDDTDQLFEAKMDSAISQEDCIINFYQAWINLAKTKNGLDQINDLLRGDTDGLPVDPSLGVAGFNIAYDKSIETLSEASLLGENQKVKTIIQKAIKLDQANLALYKTIRDNVKDGELLTKKSARFEAKRQIRELRKAIKFKNSAKKAR